MYSYKGDSRLIIIRKVNFIWPSFQINIHKKSTINEIHAGNLNNFINK